MENNPTLEIEKLVQDMQQNMHTCIPGKIDSFDAGKCLAVVVPTGQFITPGGKKLDYPKVHDVPVHVLQHAGQKCTIAFPIKKDDGCILFFAEQQLDQFRDGEEAKCDLRFDLTNAIAVVGLFAQANDVVKDACDNEAIIIDHNTDSRVTIKKDEQEYKVGDDSTCTIKKDSQECKVGGAKWTLAKGKLLVDCDLEVTGKVTAQKTIDAQGNITSAARVEGRAGVSGATADLDLHAHNCTAPGSPSGPPIPLP
jgi:hypothetical protein